MLAVPEVGVMKPASMRMVVDLPAPLGPRKPSTSPRATLKDTLSTAVKLPKRLVRPLMTISGGSVSAATVAPLLVGWARWNSAIRGQRNPERRHDEGLTP